MLSNLYPRQDIPDAEKEKNDKAWYKEHLYYAETILNLNRTKIAKMNRLYNSYNGITEAESIKYLVSTYGKRNRAKYVSYRLSKVKLDMMVGEWLKMPLNATIKTINAEAVTEKMKKYELMLAAMHAKPELEKLKSVGVDVMEGAEVPDKNDPNAFSKMSFKSKNESVMQILLKQMIKEFGVHEKLSKNMQDCTITSRVWGRNIINDRTGEMNFETYDPRDAIYMEFDRDPFIEKSPIKGVVNRIPVNKILTMFNLSQEDRDKLDAIRRNPNNYVSDSKYRGRYSYHRGEFCADVIHIEWKGVRPKYSKLTPKTNNQMEFDDSYNTYNTDLKASEYENNRKDYDKAEAKGKMKVVTEWEEDLYEGCMIGHDIFTNLRRKPFINRDEDTGKILDFSYHGLIFNAVDGETISLKEVCENFDNIFDIVMYQILKEINKAKGKVIVYDRAGLPKKTTVKNVLYNALNDSFIDIDSSAAGNMAGKDLNINQVFKEIDLGVSGSFQVLMQMKRDIIEMVDMITGINNARQGQTSASSTVTNNMQNLESSRTITEPLFYYMTKYAENVMNGMIETGKLVYGLYQTNKAKILLGDEKFRFLQITKDIAFARYQAELVNPRWEDQIRQRMRQMAEFSLNAKELRPQDVLDFELSETLADANALLKKAWDDIQKMRQQDNQQKLAVQQQIAGQQSQAQIQMMREDREDRQASELTKIREKGRVDVIVESVKQKGDMIAAQHAFDQEQIQPTPPDMGGQAAGPPPLAE